MFKDFREQLGQACNHNVSCTNTLKSQWNMIPVQGIMCIQELGGHLLPPGAGLAIPGLDHFMFYSILFLFLNALASSIDPPL